MPLRRAAALALLLLAILPAAARASDSELSIMQDDNQLLYRGDAVSDATLTKMKALGVDTVRVTLLWSNVAENARSTKARDKRYRTLGGASPKAYPKANWDPYDHLVQAARARGITVYFSVTGPGPAWGHKKPPRKYRKDARWWEPKPTEYYKFVQAVGKRYSGTYKDEDNGRTTLPRVTMWSLWNEPNQGGWLRPQWLNGKAMSPSIYRALFTYARRALVSTGHGGDTILLGETAPRSVKRRTTTSAMGVRTFANELLCGPGSDRIGCGTFAKTGPLQATAWAHHPYTRSNPPTVPEADSDEITLANFAQLGTLLDALAKTGHIRSGMPLMSTEFGYETNPPDPFAGVNLDQQASYLATADLLTYLNPRVLGSTQFLLYDVPPDKSHKVGSKAYWGTYQSGLITAGGTTKPAASAYAFAFIAAPSGQADPTTGAPQTTVFGHLRFRPHTAPGVADSVQLQFKPADGSSDWAPYGDPVAVTNPLGYFVADVATPGAPGQLRASWNGGAVTSLGQPVG